MRCELVEERLNRLLDRRLHWSHDPELVGHCAQCAICRTLADTYATISLYSVTSLAPPTLPPNFANRVLAAVAANENCDAVPKPTKLAFSENRLAIGPFLPSRFMAVAAMLLVAIFVGFLFRPGVSPTISSAGVTVANGSTPWQFREGFVQWLEEENRFSDDVWRSTGREIATLPLQVRRAAAYSESSQLTGAIRPVAAAWQALWRVFPGESDSAEPAAGETSLFAVSDSFAWA